MAFLSKLGGRVMAGTWLGGNYGQWSLAQVAVSMAPFAIGRSGRERGRMRQIGLKIRQPDEPTSTAWRYTLRDHHALSGHETATGSGSSAARSLPLPRLTLPTFQLRTGSDSDRRETGHAAPASRPVLAPRASAPRPAPRAIAQPMAHSYAQPLAQVARPAAPIALPARPVMAAAAPRPSYTATASAVSAGSAISAAYAFPTEESWKDRLTPANVGILAVGMVLLLIMFSATGSPRRALPNAALPAAPSDVSQLGMRRSPVGIPSPSAAASITLERTGKAPKNTTTLPMKGIPSAATADSMSPQKKLPMTRADGLPAESAQRDSWANEARYNAADSATLGMERQPSQPVVTPGDSAAYADTQSNRVAVGGGANEDYPTPSNPNIPF